MGGEFFHIIRERSSGNHLSDGKASKGSQGDAVAFMAGSYIEARLTQHRTDIWFAVSGGWSESGESTNHIDLVELGEEAGSFL